jgi:hypothetical protein
MTEDGDGNPLSNPAKQPLYIYPSVDYGYTIFTSVEIFDLPVQLYLNLEVTPGVSQSGEVTEATVKAMVVDETGAKVPDLEVTFNVVEGGGTLSGESSTTDANGEAGVSYTIGDLPAGEDFIIETLGSQVVEVGYGAAAAQYSLVSFFFENAAPVLSDFSIDETGYETENTTWSITGKATDDWTIVELTGQLDENDPVDLTRTGDDWEFAMSDLAVGEHNVTIFVEDEWGLNASVTFNFEVLEPTIPNTPPSLSDLTPVAGFKTKETEVNVTGKAIDAEGLASIKLTLDNGTPVNAMTEGDDFWYVFTGLTVGEHSVFIEVTDTFGEKVNDTVTFTVEEVVEPPDDDDEEDNTMLWVAIIIIIIIIIVIAVFMMMRGGGEPAPAPEPVPEPEEEEE